MTMEANHQKKRAPIACVPCRNRKTRCDIVRRAPCTNCKHFSMDCTVYSHNHVKSSSHNSRASNLRLNPFGVEFVLESSRPMHGKAPIEACLSSNHYFRTAQLRRLPPYVKPFPQQVSNKAVDYLQAKGALDLPSDNLRNQLLRCYIEFVHGLLPILELHDFLNTIERGDGVTGRLSLLLVQAVMFAGAAFVDMQHLRAAGFRDRRDARKAYYEKARMLYEFDYENDATSIIQSLLLLTYWYETPEDPKDIWHWMGITISLLSTFILPQAPRLWKRIKWSCFVRDRLVALAMGRPTRIDQATFDVPSLTLEDFELKPVAIETSCVPSECIVVRDVEMLRHLANLCIENTKLCQCLGRVLETQFSPRKQFHNQYGSESPTGMTTMLFPKGSESIALEVTRCDEDLSNWKAGLLGAVSSVPPVVTNLTDGKASLIINSAVLDLIYLATINTLHRSGTLFRNHTDTDGELSQNYINSCIKVQQSAVDITGIVKDLHNLNLTRFLPATGVTVLVPAMTTHILGMKSASAGIRIKAVERFNECMFVMEYLKENYAAAGIAVQFLTAAREKAILQGCGDKAVKPPSYQPSTSNAYTSSMTLPIGPQLDQYSISFLQESSTTASRDDEDVPDNVEVSQTHWDIDLLLNFGSEVEVDHEFCLVGQFEILGGAGGGEIM